MEGKRRGRKERIKDKKEGREGSGRVRENKHKNINVHIKKGSNLLTQFLVKKPKGQEFSVLSHSHHNGMIIY